MQFLVIGHDGTDGDALDRRMAARPAHVALGDRMRASGQMICGAAILDDDGKMIGSVLICEFESRADLDKWLENEPYVTGDVWKTIDIQPCKVGPSFVPQRAQH